MGESLSLLEKGFKPGETKSEMTDYFFHIFYLQALSDVGTS